MLLPAVAVVKDWPRGIFWVQYSSASSTALHSSSSSYSSFISPDDTFLLSANGSYQSATWSLESLSSPRSMKLLIPWCRRPRWLLYFVSSIKSIKLSSLFSYFTSTESLNSSSAGVYRRFSDRLLLAVIANTARVLTEPSSTVLLHLSLSEEEPPPSDCSRTSSCILVDLICRSILRAREVRWPKEEEKSTIDVFPIDSTIDPNMLSPSVLFRFSEQEFPKML